LGKSRAKESKLRLEENIPPEGKTVVEGKNRCQEKKKARLALRKG